MPPSSSAPIFVPKTDAIFEYQAHPLSAKLSAFPDEDDRHYSASRMVFQSAGNNGQQENLVTADYFESHRSGAKPLVIVLPIWGTYTFPVERMVSTLRKKSRGRMNILRIHGEASLYDWPVLQAAQTEQAFKAGIALGTERVRNTVIDLRRIVDWTEKRDELDSSRIGLIGFSMGAVVSSIAAANEPRLSPAVLVMGGANPSQIFANCDGKLGDTRSVVQDRFNWGQDEYQRAVADVLAHGNVANYPNRVNPRQILVIEAGKDDCMPKQSREALWRAMGQPARITLNYGHKMSFMAMTTFGLNLLPRQVYRFMRDNL